VNVNEVIIHTDGAARGNPGPAAIAAVIKDKQGKTITTVSRRIGTATNNNAEYRAVILGLEKAIMLGVRFVEIRSDSELIVKQIHGRYHVKNSVLLQLYQQVKQLEFLLEGFTINHIPRHDNNEANNLANRTLDLVKHIDYAPNCQLLINLKQTNNENRDILFLRRLTGILSDFPGTDQVRLSFDVGDKIISLRLSNICVNYCHELREQLKGLVGKRGIRVKELD